MIVVGISLGHFLWVPKIFLGLYSYMGAFEVFIGAPLGYQLCFQDLGFSSLPIWFIPRLSTWALVILRWPYFPYLGIEGAFAEVILQVSWLGRGQIAQSLYVLKLRATIIGYEPLLVVYGSLKPILGETYLFHLGAHLSYPWFACDLDLEFLRCMLCAR